MSRSVVISGPPAVGKTTVARALAGEFGMEYVSGGDILKRMAGGADSGCDWWDTQPGIEFLKRRQSDDSFDRRVDREMIPLFLEGGRVITSYTIPWLTDGGIKIWLAGSLESSAARMRARDDIGELQATRVAVQRYEKNRSLYQRLYGFEFGRDLSVFDEIIDTDSMDAQEVIAAAGAAIGRLL